MPPPILLAWARIDEIPGTAYGRVLHLPDVVIYEGWEVAASATTAWAVRFRLIVDDRTFVARALEVDADGPHGLRRLSVRRSPKGQWWVDGKRRPDLDPCLDADVAATPLTNAPTIRRLSQAPGDGVDIVVAWVDIPSLAIASTRQGYDRLPDALDGTQRHRFRTVEGDAYVLTTDGDSLVRDYERLFRRISRR